ncbi:dTMP kinase [Candidatus Saccharibacteria bacterium]|nr:dTMP kinase [Candidatus Saccharibacteria bacterium]MBQ6149511.1 dTMP kinase [Candidatus Saccharibacteria bacterium]
MYIVIEGQDGTGKSTQVRLLQEYFEKQGKKVVVMDEPDGDLPQAHDLHDLILIKGKDYNMEPMTNVLLFTASRSELWRKIAEPTLKEGGVVISARNWWSTLAYQGYGEGVSRSKIIKITHESLPERYVKPDKGFILTVSDKVREERQKDRGKAVETFEAKPDEFQQKVNSAYPKIAKDFDVKIIDASGTIEEVFELILREL